MPAVHWAGLGTSMEDTCSHPENMLPMFMPPKGKPPPKGLSLCNQRSNTLANAASAPS